MPGRAESFDRRNHRPHRCDQPWIGNDRLGRGVAPGLPCAVARRQLQQLGLDQSGDLARYRSALDQRP